MFVKLPVFKNSALNCLAYFAGMILNLTKLLTLFKILANLLRTRFAVLARQSRF